MNTSIPQRLLGSTDIKISALGLGTVKLGRNKGVKYPTGFELPTDPEASRLIGQAKEAGINLIDTAPAYGSSEERLGKLLAGQQQDWVICSKVGEEFDGHTSRFDFSAAHTRQSIERSLRRLNRDVIDILLVHSDGRDVDIIENSGVFDALEACKREGLIRAYGMSSKTLAGGLLAAKESDCVMVTYNPGYREEEPVIDRCLHLGRGVLLKKALASGHLAASNGEDPVAACMNFAFAHPGVTSAIVGTINPSHLTSNIAHAQQALRQLAPRNERQD